MNIMSSLLFLAFLPFSLFFVHCSLLIAHCYKKGRPRKEGSLKNLLFKTLRQAFTLSAREMYY